MTREEAKQNLIALGIEEPTDAQVTNYLNQFHYNQPQPQPQQQPQQQQREPESHQQQPEQSDGGDDGEINALRDEIDKLKRENIQKDILSYAASKGLTGEQANKILAGFKDDLDLAKTAIDSMSEIITARETEAATRKEQEIANGATNPNGGQAGSGSDGHKDEKPDDVANAESIIFGGVGEQAKSAREFYK